MDKDQLINFIKGFIEKDSANGVPEETAFSKDLIGLRIYDEPLIAFASANDSGFEDLKKPGVVGNHFILPAEWLKKAETVVSVFLPFTERIKASNRKNMDWPSNEWLHGRIEGQGFIEKFCRSIVSFMESQGYGCAAPIIDPRFSSKSPVTDDVNKQDNYTSNWSERHVANICGLGTFGLSKGLITRKGVAGRFTSFITSARFEPSVRPYKDIYEYCSRCGVCIKNCPAKAITMEEGKKHPECSNFLEKVRAKHRPYYGCGKCQVKVPCESGIPAHT